MYIMIGLRKEMMKDIADDIDFTEKLLREQGVFVLPAYMFQKPDFFRIVISPPIEMLDPACDRIEEFCEKHSLPHASSRV
jgi:tyrosine aminotransferase